MKYIKDQHKKEGKNAVFDILQSFSTHKFLTNLWTYELDTLSPIYIWPLISQQQIEVRHKNFVYTACP